MKTIIPDNSNVDHTISSNSIQYFSKYALSMSANCNKKNRLKKILHPCIFMALFFSNLLFHLYISVQWLLVLHDANYVAFTIFMPNVTNACLPPISSATRTLPRFLSTVTMFARKLVKGPEIIHISFPTPNSTSE